MQRTATHGFSLVEVRMVVAIVGVLASMAMVVSTGAVTVRRHHAHKNR